MLVALGTALLVAGSALAEGPQTTPPSLPSQVLAPPPAAHAAPAAPAYEDEPSFLETTWGGGPDGQLWVSAEYLVGWFSGDRLPPLATTSPAGTARINAGVIGGPTTVLFGGNVVNDDTRSGFRLAAGYWFNTERTLGIETSFLMLESQATGFAASSNGNPILARPFFDVTTGLNDSALVAFPGSSSGSLAARASSGNLLQATVDLTENVIDCKWFRLDSLLGYRYYNYGEGVHIRQSLTNIPNSPGTVFASEDDFSAENVFNGGDFGLRARFAWDTVSLDLLSKLAVGGVNRDVKIVGNSVTTAPGQATVSREGGLLALSSNIGDYHNHDWALVPELGATLAWQATPNVRLTLGYSVLWLDRIARAGDQIDLDVNPTLFPSATGTPVQPRFPLFRDVRNDVSFQTVNFGLEFTY
jgi:hypothetical protein